MLGVSFNLTHFLHKKQCKAVTGKMAKRIKKSEMGTKQQFSEYRDIEPYEDFPLGHAGKKQYYLVFKFFIMIRPYCIGLEWQ